MQIPPSLGGILNHLILDQHCGGRRHNTKGPGSIDVVSHVDLEDSAMAFAQRVDDGSLGPACSAGRGQSVDTHCYSLVVGRPS